MTAQFDVCVLGGGPAGACLAARLSTLGHHVAVVEQRRFPRPHVGESLSPGIWPLLDALQVSRTRIRAGAVAVREAAVRWRTEEEERFPVEGGITVDRAAFDAVLLDRARAAGATVLPPARAGRPVRVAGGWWIALGNRALHARFVADASGRRRLLGGAWTRTSPPTVALHLRSRGSRCTDEPQTHIDARPEGWLWGARLPGGDVRAMALVDPATLATEAGDPARLLRRLLRASPALARLLDPRGPAGRVAVCDASTYAVDSPIGPGFVRVGEAAFAIDPLSSSGVQTAVQTALAAAAAVHTVRTPGRDADAAVEYYTELLRSCVRHHATTAARFYADHHRYAGESFWRRRSAGAPPPPRPQSISPTDLAPSRVRLRPPAELRVTACLVGDTVERRPALHHPAFDRPVAFLGDVELAPLLDELARAPSLAAAMRAWERSLPGGRAAQIAAWLQAHRLLEPAP